jgi:prenylcysteine oxidase/farnesylcysteine lyase
MTTSQFKVAVIGAGAAGSVAAYHLWQRVGERLDLTIFERKEHVGGRAWDINFAGTRIEVGGTLLHSSGKYTMELMGFTSSVEGKSGLSIDGKSETYAFWTDKGFPICTKTSLAAMAFGIVKHVGIPSAQKTVNAAVAMANKWEKIYELQSNGDIYQTPQEMLRALDLFDATQVSLKDYLDKLGVNGKMTHNVVEAIVHNMYNQGAEIGALAGLVGLAGAGLAGGYLFAVEDGNWTIYDKAIRKIGADLRVNTKIRSVEKISAAGGSAAAGGEAAGNAAAGGEVGESVPSSARAPHFKVTSEDGKTEIFDAVILAAPPTLADVELLVDGSPLNVNVYPYQKVETTFVVGDLNPRYFKCSPKRKLPSTIFTADSAGAPFKSIGVTGFSPEHNARIYKIFSAEHKMEERELGEIFSKIYDTCRFVWQGAYPVISPGINHLPYELAPGLFYACAFETAAGAIEVESVSGWNTAELATTYLKRL